MYWSGRQRLNAPALLDPGDARLGNETLDWPLHAARWNSHSVWLEDARIDCIKDGEEEREEVLRILLRIFRDTFATNDGTEFGVVRRALGAVQRDLGEGNYDPRRGPCFKIACKRG